MKRFLCVTLVLTTIFTVTLIGQSFDRFSKNPIPKLNVIGIALSEDAATAKTVVEDFYRKQMRLKMEFPYLVDPSYKKLGEQKAFSISLFGKSTSGKKYFTLSDSLLELNANPFTLLIVDRNKRIRAFTQGIIIDPREVSRVVEELLLNIEGKEQITVDSGEPSMAEGWQTDLGKANAEKNEKPALINLGLSKKLWYAQLGKALPDFPLQTADGKETGIHAALGGKVSALFFWLGSSQTDIGAVAGGTGIMSEFVNNLYHSFTLGEAEPGDEEVKNAVADPEQPKQ